MYQKICKICGKEFYTNYHNQALCTLPHPKKCLGCGKEIYVRGRNYKADYCSDECRLKIHGKKCVLCGCMFLPKNRSQITCDSKHFNTCVVCGERFEMGPREKDRKTCCKQCSCKYRKQIGWYVGVRSKAKQTILKKYGSDTSYNVSKKPKVCPECGKYYIPTSNNQKWCSGKHYRPCPICGKGVEVKYGEKVTTCSEQCRQKLIKKTSLIKYGEDNFFKTSDFQEKRNQLAYANMV